MDRSKERIECAAKTDLNRFLIECLHDLLIGSSTVEVLAKLKEASLKCPDYHVDNWVSGKISTMVIELFNEHALDQGSLYRLPTIESLGVSFDCSANSLRRKLAKEDESYTSLKSDFVAQYGLLKYKKGVINMHSLAHSLGYSETSLFRFMSKYASKTPKKYFQDLVDSENAHH